MINDVIEISKIAGEIMLRLAAPFAITMLVGPIIFGLAATLLPALGYFPSLGGTHFSFEPFQRLFERPGLIQSAGISLASALSGGAAVGGATQHDGFQRAQVDAGFGGHL